MRGMGLKMRRRHHIKIEVEGASRYLRAAASAVSRGIWLQGDGVVNGFNAIAEELDALTDRDTELRRFIAELSAADRVEAAKRDGDAESCVMLVLTAQQVVRMNELLETPNAQP